MKKYLLIIILALFSFSATNAEIRWKLSDDGTLTISGTDMPDYTAKKENDKISVSAPWYSQKNKIKKIVIEDGVTSIGDWAFPECKNLTSITIPNSVTS
ncbi:MAG: leucine-rich repeat protein, partial [Prevotella sp.]|nr:leucine-rich repeat protein [Prevotella sp.]